MKKSARILPALCLIDSKTRFLHTCLPGELLYSYAG